MARVREYSSIGFLIFALVIVVALICQIRKNIDMVPTEKTVLPKGQRVGVVDSSYWNYLQYFSITRPSDGWKIQSFGEIDSLGAEDTTRSVFENTIPLLKMTKTDSDGGLAIIEIGVIEMTKNWTPKRLAIQALGETIRKYETTDQRVRLLTQTTSPVHSSGQGAFFVIVLPADAQEAQPVWVFTVILRRHWAFTILCRTSENEYPKVRADFVKTIKNFRFLPVGVGGS